MITLLDQFPANILAVRMDGQVTREDYDEVLIPAAEIAFKEHTKLRVYYEMDPDLKGFDAGAIWEDFTYGMGHMTKWERIAVVTNVSWVKQAINILGFMLPCPVKVFPSEKTAQAREWILA